MPRRKSGHVDSPTAVGERLREAREQAGLTQLELAFPGCSASYISRVEAGKRIPSLQLLRELGRHLGVSGDYLATGTEAEADAFSMSGLVEAEVALRLDDRKLASDLYAQVLERATRDADRAEAVAGLGQLAFREGNPKEAIEKLEEAFRLWRSDGGDRPSAADTLGRAYAMVGDLPSAITLFERCLEGASRRDDRFGEIQFALLLAEALIDTGNLRRAEELLAHARVLGEGLENARVRIDLYWSQSRLHAYRDEPEQAAEYASRALEVLRMTEDMYRTGRAYQLLAYIELTRDRAEEALRLLAEGRPLIDGSCNEVEQAQYRLEEARALAKLGRADEAAGLAMEVAGLVANAQPEDAARSYSVVAEVFTSLEEYARARELYELAAELLEANASSPFLVDVYARLADLLDHEGHKNEAYEFMKKALSVRESLLSAGSAARRPI